MVENIEKIGTAPSRVRVSFEFFPPKTPAMEAMLWSSVATLLPLRPEFFSVTYGAGGSTRERTHDIVSRLVREGGAPPAAHLTCVGASRDEVDAVAQAYWDAGVRHIVALRGDPPDAQGTFQPHPQGYASAAELVAGLKRIADFEISVAAYPETHPEATSPEADLDHLKRKLDAGASRAITQFFFEADTFLRFRDRAVAHGITADIVPGILPVHVFANTVRMADMCGTHVPAWMHDLFHGIEKRHEIRHQLALAVAADLCRRLVVEGVDAFHFYTLNRAEISYALCRLLNDARPFMKA